MECLPATAFSSFIFNLLRLEKEKKKKDLQGNGRQCSVSMNIIEITDITYRK